MPVSEENEYEDKKFHRRAGLRMDFGPTQLVNGEGAFNDNVGHTARSHYYDSHQVDDLRASWTMAKEAAGFEVHGPAIFRM